MAVLDVPDSACSTQAVPELKKKKNIIPTEKDKFMGSLPFRRK
jgi:hypothetical protein